jgi:hypothetical protein
MKLLISACTDKAFEEGLMPMAHLTTGTACAMNDNAIRTPTRRRHRLHHPRHVVGPVRQVAS